MQIPLGFFRSLSGNGLNNSQGIESRFSPAIFEEQSFLQISAEIYIRYPPRILLRIPPSISPRILLKRPPGIRMRVQPGIRP